MRSDTIVGWKKSSPSFFRNAKSVFGVMSSRRRFQLSATIALTILSTISELVTIGAVLPLLALAVDNNYLANAPFVQSVLRFFGAEPGVNLLGFFAILLVIAAALSGVTRLMLVMDQSQTRLWDSI